MKRRNSAFLPILVALLTGPILLSVTFAETKAGRPENLARTAKIRASSHYSADYVPQRAADGNVPGPLSRADVGMAWAVRGEEAQDKGWFTLEWERPVTLSEIVYYGRTAWMLTECWKDYEVYLDAAEDPVSKGSFRKAHGPQRIRFPATACKKVTLRFLSSYGGLNPGAAEILAFASHPTDRALARLLKLQSATLAGMPGVAGTDCDGLANLIHRLVDLHGKRYRESSTHLARQARLRRARAEAEASSDPLSAETLDEVQEKLEALEREVLLFDVGKLVVIKRHEITATHVYTYHYEGFRAGGGLYVISAQDPESDPVELVSSPTGQILDCDLSYDGKTILFSWRRQQNEGYHLWTIDTDGSNLRRLTDGEWHDYNPCWLPDGGIAFLTTRSPQFAYCWHAPVGILYRMAPDGSDLRRLSANYLNDFTPSVLDDGRIIYTRWEYVDRPAIPIQSLWTMNPDGTSLAGFFGNRVLSPGTFMEARAVPGTNKIICTMTGHNGPTRGAIGVIDRARGVNAQRAIQNITPDVPVPDVDKGNGNTGGSKQYSCPLPLDSVRFLLSARGPVLVRTISGSCQSVALPAPADGMQYFSAQPIRPRRRPPAIPSNLPEKNEDFAVVFVQDVYNGLEPHVKRGEVKAIRVVRELEKAVRIDPSLRAFGFQFPVISCGATYAAKMVLGDVPVEPDGSACFRVPAAAPVYFMALDAQGRAVQRMRSFTHLMPGETQGCIGCHESRQESPRAAIDLARRCRNPRDLEKPEWGLSGFDYSRIVQPVLDKYCVECHDAVDPPKGIDLTAGKTDFFNVSYDVLARENQGRRGTAYVNWIPSYNGQEWNILEVKPRTWGSPASKLADVVLSNHPDEAGKPRFQMDERSRRRILAWIDLNVPYYGTSETAHPEKNGCRRIYPGELDKVLADVASRRCAGCHKGGKIPRRVWTRITEPELNPFLMAPLGKAAGGSGKCGGAVFADRSDPDYRAILATFSPVEALVKSTPRMDMLGASPSPDVLRSCQ